MPEQRRLKPALPELEQAFLAATRATRAAQLAVATAEAAVTAASKEFSRCQGRESNARMAMEAAFDA